MKAKIHTPGVHQAILDRVDVRRIPGKPIPSVRLRYVHKDDKFNSASILQHITWVPEESPGVPEIGAYILSRIFSRLGPETPERKQSYWMRYDVVQVARLLQKFCGRTFEITVENRCKPQNPEESYPNLKFSFCVGNPTSSPKGA